MWPPNLLASGCMRAFDMNWTMCTHRASVWSPRCDILTRRRRYKAPGIRTTLLTPGYMQTAMFSRSGYASRNPSTPLPPWLFRFLAPQVQPHEVVKRIIAAIDDHQSRTIAIPFFVNVARFGVLLPSWGRDFLQWVSHVSISATMLFPAGISQI
jgi:hypothetical protein